MRISNLFLLGIIILAIVLRFYQLGNIPASLNHDETALGYNAYALLKTGADEHGAFLPLSLRSFGDWKLPVYPLISIPFVAIFGLTELAIRLPSALAGVIGVILVMLLSKELFKQKEISFFTGLCYALSPWNIYFSRMAYEANLATTFFLAGLLLFIRSIEKNHPKQFFLGLFFFAITMFTYHAFVIFMPVFIAGLFFLYRKQLFSTTSYKVGSSIVVLIIFVSLFSSILGSIGKLSDFSIFGDTNVIYNRAEKIRTGTSSEPFIIKEVLFNKYTVIPYQIGQNYLATFSPSFLFDKGGEKLLHTLGVFGNLYLFDAILLIAGIGFFLWNREKSWMVLGIWLISSPIASAITKDAPSSTRLVMLLPLLMLLAGYGGYSIFTWLQKQQKFIFYGGVFFGSLLCFVNVIYFINLYFNHIDVMRGKFLHYGYKQMVEVAKKYPDKNIVVRGPENFPYISFLFYTKYDPKKFQDEVEYYPKEQTFDYVKNFGRYSFVHEIDYSKLEKNTVYITDRVTNDAPNKILFPSGETGFVYEVTN